MPWPTFLIIGAARCGTTTLFDYLRRHPQVFTSRVKELNYFALGGAPAAFRGPGDEENLNRHAVSDEAAYLKLFGEGRDARAVGEASPSYLFCPEAAERIRAAIPQVKLIAILREPVERAYSNYLFMLAYGREPLLSFEDALDAEEERLRLRWEHAWFYARLGRYGEQLSRYFRLFSRDQVLVVFHEDLAANEQRTMREVYRFIGVDPELGSGQTLRSNASVRLDQWPHRHSVRLDHYLNQPHWSKPIARKVIPRPLRGLMVDWLKDRNRFVPPLTERMRQRLRAYYREDQQLLSSLLQRDLSRWRA